MIIAAHQENEKTGEREAREEKKQSTDFKEAACCPSVVVQSAARGKMVCLRQGCPTRGTRAKCGTRRI